MESQGASRYDEFARAVADEGLITDPWIDGVPRLREEPIVISQDQWQSLARAASQLGAVYDELCMLVREDPALATDFFCLSTWQKAMWGASQPLWHGLARVDLFVTADGIAAAELNCDTPTGEPEAVVLGALARRSRPDLIDPNAGLEARYCAMLETLAARELGDGLATPRRVGLVYPTEFTEDLSLIRLYKRWLEARGHSVILGSPFNLERGQSGALELLGSPIDVLLRHYKTDWWGERLAARDDEALEDGEALQGPLGAAIEALLDRRVSVVNPFGSVLPQNKRSMAFMWEYIHAFSAESQATIERYVPVTSRFESLHQEQLRVQQADWVIKSDYGAEGDEVIVGCRVDEASWGDAIAHGRAGKWVAQRYFNAETDADGAATNFGVYLVAGEVSGVYARVQVEPTDARAVSCPVLVVP